MKCQIVYSGKNKKNITNVSSVSQSREWKRLNQILIYTKLRCIYDEIAGPPQNM